jgi:plasmid replication initiation protein
LDYLHEAQGAGETPAIPVERFKALLGAENYSWEDVTKRVLKPALKDITTLTPLRITLRTKKHGRKITDVKFLVRYAAPEGLPEKPSVTSENVTPSLLHTTRDYDAIFQALAEDEQSVLMQRAEAELPSILREYVAENAHTYDRIAKPSVLQNRNLLLEEYLQEQAFRKDSF